MIIHDKKNAIATIMSGRRSPKGEQLTEPAPMAPELPTKSEDGEIDGRHAAAMDILSALHEKSAHKLMEALGNFHDLHVAHSKIPMSPSTGDEGDLKDE